MRVAAEIIETVIRYECPKCGNNCQCGVPYMPKTARATEAIKANPEKSDRAIAAEIGVNQSTVSRARQLTDADASVRRTGLDGKTRRMPRKFDDDMPTEEEAEESYQETLYDQACLLLESMAGSTRQRFFAFLKRKYRDD